MNDVHTYTCTVMYTQNIIGVADDVLSVRVYPVIFWLSDSSSAQ